MDDTAFSLDNLTSNPDFNFSHKMSSINDDDDDFVFDSPYGNSNFTSSYCDPINLPSALDTNNFSCMSLNIQSISAKFNEFSELINVLSNLNCAPDIICLQEIWRFPTYHNFKLVNYHPFIYKTRESSQGGGVGFFIKNTIKFKMLPEFSIFSEKIIETLFIEVTISNKRFIIGNIYRS